MKLIELLNDRRFPKLVEEYWKVELWFSDKLNEETLSSERVGIGKLWDEYYYESMPHNYYYKRFGNLIKIIPNKEKQVKNIRVGCSGRQFDATFNVTEEMDNIDKFFEVFKCIK